MNIIETSAESKPSPTRKTEITLPGNLAPYSESSIYARTNGYLKAWKTDLGAKVAAGQLMAEISAPDVDAQSNQATANLAQAQANQTIAQLNFNRQQDLLAKAVSSRQEFDQSHANFDSTTVEATQGFSPEDRIVVDPSDSLADNAKVNVKERDTNQ